MSPIVTGVAYVVRSKRSARIGCFRTKCTIVRTFGNHQGLQGRIPNKHSRQRCIRRGRTAACVIGKHNIRFLAILHHIKKLTAAYVFNVYRNSIRRLGRTSELTARNRTRHVQKIVCISCGNGISHTLFQTRRYGRNGRFVRSIGGIGFIGNYGSVGFIGSRGRIGSIGQYYTAACKPRRSYHIARNFFPKQHPRVFGIVNVDISRTRNGLHRVVSTHFPSIHGVFFHPLQKHVLAFHNPARTPHIRCAPTGIYVKDNTSAVAANVLPFAVRIVITAALPVSLVATTAVFRNGRRTKHHNVVFTVTVCIPFAIRPSMFSIPSRAAIPSTADLFSRIEGRNLAVITAYTVGIAKQISRCIVRSLVGLRIRYNLFQRFVQRTARNGTHRRAARVSRKHVVRSAPCIETFRHRAQEFALLVARTPVCNVFSTLHVVNVGRFRITRRRRCRGRYLNLCVLIRKCGQYGCRKHRQSQTNLCKFFHL